jgi:hypothetical protein
MLNVEKFPRIVLYAAAKQRQPPVSARWSFSATCPGSPSLTSENACHSIARYYPPAVAWLRFGVRCCVMRRSPDGVAAFRWALRPSSEAASTADMR